VLRSQILPKLAQAMQSGFGAQVARLGGMLLIGQLLYFLAAPMLSRLYSPAAFGVFGLLYSSIALTSPLVCLNYDTAIPVPRDDRSALDLAAAAILFGFLTSAIVSLFLFVLTSLGFFGLGWITPSLVVLVAALMASQGFFQAAQAWQIRTNDVHQLGLSHLYINGGRGAAQVAAGFAQFGASGLLFGEVFGRVIACVQLARTPFKARHQLGWQFNLAASRAAIKDCRRFVTTFMPAQILDLAVPLIFIGSIASSYGAAVAGQYFLMRRVLDVPISLVARTVADVYSGRIAEFARRDTALIRPLLIKTALLLGAVSIVCVLPLMFAAPFLIATIFGDEWRLAGMLTAIMAPAAALTVIVSPVTRVFVVTSRPRLRLAYSAMQILSICLVLMATLYWKFDILNTAILISAVVSASYVVNFFAAYIAAGWIHNDAAGSSPK
jgi:O-antigen/teichoic acid export membrane protein